MEGIISSGELFATHIRFLNDWEEVEHGITIAFEGSENLPEQIGQFPLRATVQKILKQLLRPTAGDDNDPEVYITSFTEESDSLSQWRGYSHNSLGASIGFDLTRVRPAPASGSLVAFAPCVYEPETTRTLILGVLKTFQLRCERLWLEVTDPKRNRTLIENHKQAHQCSIDSAGTDVRVEENQRTNFQYHDAVTSLKAQLLQSVALLKNHHFKDENEWRLVLPHMRSKNRKDILFRVGTRLAKPYLKFSYRDNGDHSVTIKEVRLGPGSEDQALLKGWNMFLKSKGVEVEAVPSRVPYRPE